MPWIKKNLTLVFGGLVGLALLAGSGFFLFSQLQRESEVDSQLVAKKDQWTSLNNQTPYPDEKNIKAVREEAERVEKLAVELRSNIHPPDVPPVTDTYRLRALIETAIVNLTREADEAGVTLPNNYAFTFQKLRELGGEFNSNAIPKIAMQVSQISTLCRVLFDAKVHSLDTLKRSPVLKEEGGGADYLSSKGLTNQWVMRTPYDLSFRSFSSELAGVIQGLAALDQCVVIKTLNVETTTLPPRRFPMPGMTFAPPPQEQPTGSSGPTMSPELRARYGLGPGGPGSPESRYGSGGESPGSGMSPELRARYGLGAGGRPGMGPDMRSRYGLGPGAGPSYAAPQSLMSPVTPPNMTMPMTPAGPKVVLEEKPLRIILQLDFVTPAPAARIGKPSPRPPAAPAEPAEESNPDAAPTP